MTYARRVRWAVLAAAILALAACGEPERGSVSADDATSDDADASVPGDGATLSPDGVTDAPGSDDMTEDLGGLPALHVGPALSEVAVDPLAGLDLEACAVYRDERCVGGRDLHCEIYDPATSVFVDEPDALLRRSLLYDRWYDLYMSPDGQTCERRFVKTMLPDAPESEWSDPIHFSSFDGWGDGALWNGSAVNAATFRYATTGTEADYQRMEQKVRAIVRGFDLTGVPGYLARAHFLWYPDGGPASAEHLVVHGAGIGEHSGMNTLEDPASVEGLPALYLEGLPDEHGEMVKGVPMWGGHPSIDSYTGAMVSLPIAWPLLRDEGLKDRIAEHLTCYLKRLRRIEVIKLQQNPEALDSLRSYLGSADVTLEPGDPDPAELDRIVLFAHYGINTSQPETFDRTCPGELRLDPDQVLDATAPDFLLQMISLAQDMDGDGSKPRRVRPIDHVYIPTLRGGDASHMMHLATLAWWFTGEEQYRRFLYEELIGRLDTVCVAHIMQAFNLPDFCHTFFDDHITYGTHWQFIRMLRDSELKTEMQRVMEEENWQKRLSPHANAKFNVLYASSVPEDMATGRARALQELGDQLAVLGGTGSALDAPRRHMAIDRAAVIAAFPEGVSLRCPTEQERLLCEDGGDVFGVPVGEHPMSYPCDGRATECVMEDGACIEGIASGYLPSNLRRYADYMWQRSPYQVGEDVADEGRLQSPGLDLSEPYWIARYFGYLDGGEGQVLAWRDHGACQDP
jgi:hypothetical protein